MNAKNNINQKIWKLLQGDLAIQRNLQRGITNIRALAKFLIKRHSLNASLDSVISAIRRFQSGEIFEEHEKVLLPLFKDASVSTRYDLACITLNISPAGLFNKACNKIGLADDFKIVGGSKKLKIITEANSLRLITDAFTKSEINKIEPDLGEINIKLHERAVKTKGVIARISSELSLANINIEEFLICPPEFLIYIKKKDMIRAHESVLRLCEAENFR